MMKLPRERCRSVPLLGGVRFDLAPLQLGMQGHPWRIAVASMLLNCTRRGQVEPVLKHLLARWPTPADLAHAEGVEEAVKPCGLQRRRARQLQRMSVMWLGDAWEDMRDLPGVGAYVADAVGLFAFGCTDLESNDYALHSYVRSLTACS